MKNITYQIQQKESVDYILVLRDGKEWKNIIIKNDDIMVFNIIKGEQE